MFGEPVSRAPMPSIRPDAVSITFEFRKPSSRMRVSIVRSVWAVAVVARRSAKASVRNFMRAGDYSNSAQSIAVGTFDFAKILVNISAGVKIFRSPNSEGRRVFIVKSARCEA